MTPQSAPAWPRPVLALAQVWIGTALMIPLREPEAPWHAGYAALAAAGGLVGLAFLGLALRHCVVLWREPREPSSALVVVALPVILFSGVVATGPMSVGSWQWQSLPFGALAAYLLVVVARELGRWLRRSGRRQVTGS